MKEKNLSIDFQALSFGIIRKKKKNNIQSPLTVLLQRIKKGT